MPSNPYTQYASIMPPQERRGDEPPSPYGGYFAQRAPSVFKDFAATAPTYSYRATHPQAYTGSSMLAMTRAAPPVTPSAGATTNRAPLVYDPGQAAVDRTRAWNERAQQIADQYNTALANMQNAYAKAGAIVTAGGGTMPAFNPGGAPQAQAAGAGGYSAPQYDVPYGVDPVWYMQFIEEHPYTTKDGRQIHLTPEQVYSRDGDYAIAHALMDKAWGDQFYRTYGRPPSEDDWKASYSQRQRAYYNYGG